MRTGLFPHLTLLSVVAWVVVCVACAPRVRQMTALPGPAFPPAPQPFLAPEPPVTAVSLDAEWQPSVATVDLEAASRTPLVTSAIRRADERYQAGEALLRSGDSQKARAEFDQAIDILLETPVDAWDRRRIEQKCDELVERVTALGAETGHHSALESADAAPAVADGDAVAADATMKFDPVVSLPPSELPLEVNGSVLKWIRYFMTENGRKVLVGGLRRQGRYRAMIQRILDEEGLPQELIYLAQAESLFKPRAVSTKKAAGIWQFMDYRGREYGLRRTSDFDERLDPEKATRAAARHLRDLYQDYGNWYLAMVGYNAGPMRVIRARRRTGQTDFWEFHKRKAIPRETRDYVPMILAITIMAKKPKDYGLEDIVADPPLEYSTIHIHTATHLGLVADILARPLDEIRELNPAVLKDVVSAGHSVHVPPGQGAFVMSALEMVPASRRDSWRVHRMGLGQTLSEIAALYGASKESVLLANGGAGELAQAGDLVMVPVGYSSKKDTSRGAEARRSSSRSHASSTAIRSRARVKSAAASLRAARPRLSGLDR